MSMDRCLYCDEPYDTDVSLEDHEDCGPLPREILLSNGEVTIVDEDDFEELNKWSWSKRSCGYPGRTSWLGGGKCGEVLIHRVVNKTPKGMLTDHINGDKMDNRKRNLRTCNKSQNANNSGARKTPGRKPTSKYKGVCLHKGSFVARINWKYLGSYKTEEEAALAYNKAAIIKHGEFAYLNDIGGEK